VKTIIKGLMVVGGLVSMVAFVPSGSAHARAAEKHSSTVTVDNTRAVPVTVYLNQDQTASGNVPLGTVAPHSEATLALPPYLLDGDEIGIMVHPANGEDLGVQDLTFQKGKNLDVYVPTTNDGYIPPPPPATIPNPGKGTTTLTVQNPSNQDLMVSLQHGPFDTRLGVAPAGRETTLVIPAAFTLGDPSIQVFLTPKDGLDLDTSTFTLDHDAHLLVRVPTK